MCVFITARADIVGNESNRSDSRTAARIHYVSWRVLRLAGWLPGSRNKGLGYRAAQWLHRSAPDDTSVHVSSLTDSANQRRRCDIRAGHGSSSTFSESKPLSFDSQIIVHTFLVLYSASHVSLPEASAESWAEQSWLTRQVICGGLAHAETRSQGGIASH